MKLFKVILKSGDYKLIKCDSALELVKKYDLATKKHISTRIIELADHKPV